MNVLRVLLCLFVAAAAAVAAVISYGALRWRRETRELRSSMTAARVTGGSETVDFRELEALPHPVERYLRKALRDGQPIVASARFSPRGTINMGKGEDKWTTFSSDQLVVTQRPAFDWDARIRVAPGVVVNVHDAYTAGEGIFHAAIMGLLPVGRLKGGGMLAEGELMRFLAEAVWYPTAFLPSEGMRWEGINNQSARATMVDRSVSVTLTFTFDEHDQICTVYAASRGRTDGDEVIPTPWRGRFGNYAERSGMKIPLDGEVEWILPSGPHPYWRGKISAISYDLR